jgi:DNA-binding transcriptional LysR family regulator
MSPNIDYRYLKAFQLTAKYLNFSKAATELNIAQSAVSRQIKLLEESLTEQLIVRSSKKVILTEKGKALYMSIQRFEEMTSELTKNSGPQLIKIGILHGLLETWFIPIIKEYIQSGPHQLHIEIDSPNGLKQALVDGKLDIIFSTENIQNELVTSLRLFEERLKIISKKEIDLKNIEQYTWISYNESDFFFDLYKKHSSQIITVQSITSIIKLVKEGVGIAILPEHTLKKDDKIFSYDVKGLKRPQIHLSTLSYQNMPKHINELIDVIKKHI